MTPAAQQQHSRRLERNDPEFPSHASSFLRAAIMGSVFSFIKLIWETATRSQRGSQHLSQKVMKHPSESAGCLPQRQEEVGIRSTLPSGLIPLWADATLTSRNALCLLERQQVDGWKSVRWILGCGDAQTLHDEFYQRFDSETGRCQSQSSAGSQVTFLVVQIKPWLFFYLQVRCYSLVYFVIRRYIKLAWTAVMTSSSFSLNKLFRKSNIPNATLLFFLFFKFLPEYICSSVFFLILLCNWNLDFCLFSSGWRVISPIITRDRGQEMILLSLPTGWRGESQPSLLKKKLSDF